MERYLQRSAVTDDSTSSETADAGGGSERSAYDGTSHTACSLPSLPVSVSSDEATLAFEGDRIDADEADSTLRPHEDLLMMRNNIQDYRQLTTHVSWSPEADHDGAVDPAHNVECPITASGSGWRPKYLRRRVLVAFSAVFLLIIAALEALSLISYRNDGIAKGFNKDHYLWTYGPTAFFTLIAALFNRVEYQTKSMAPWQRLFKHPEPARKSLLLDYVSPLQPVAIFESLRNKDFAVSATTSVSILIKLLIVLSSGLITLSRIGVHHNSISMVVENTFVDDDSPLRAGNSVPYFILKGLIEGSSYPPGISQKFAFQSVQSELPDTAQYQVMVDGLTTSLQCEIAKLDMTDAEPHYGKNRMNFTITSPGCDVILTNLKIPSLNSPNGPHQLAFGKFEPLQCDGTTDDDGKRVLIMFGLQEAFANETIPIEKVDPDCTGHECKMTTNVSGRLVQSAQLVCAPTYEIAKVNIIQNGTEVQSIVSPDSTRGEVSSRTLDHISPWSFMEAYMAAFDAVIVGKSVWEYFKVGQASFLLDKYMYSLLESQATNETDVSSLYDPKFVQSIATTYHQQVGAIIARHLLLKPASLNTTGSAIIMDDRLIVREWAVQWMAGLAAICLILSILTAFIIPRHAILPQSPSTLPGIAALVARSPDLLERLRYSGDATSKTLHLQLEGSKYQSEVIHDGLSGLRQPQQGIFIKNLVLANSDTRPWGFQQSESIHSHPWILHPASRLSLGLILIALVVTLEVTLHQSSSHYGLGDVGDNGYIHYTWTSLPTLIFGGLAMMLSSVDFSIRSLAPYTSLSDIVTVDSFRTLDFLDVSVPSAIFKEAKLRNIGALATTATLLVASFFTIFSGSLFQGVSFSTTTTALLRANSSFGPRDYNTSFGVEAPLILLNNLSYSHMQSITSN